MMTDSMIPFFAVLMTAAGVIVVLAIAVDCLRQLADRWLPAPDDWPWPAGSPARGRAAAALARRGHEDVEDRPKAVAHDRGHAPEGDETAKEPRSAEILSFRPRARIRPPLRLVRSPDDAA